MPASRYRGPPMTLEDDVVGAASVSTSCSRALASKAKKISEAVAKSIGGMEDLLLARWYFARSTFLPFHPLTHIGKSPMLKGSFDVRLVRKRVKAFRRIAAMPDRTV